MADLSQVITVHTAEQVRAALSAADELGLAVTLQSAPDAIFYAGGLYLLQMFAGEKKSFPTVNAVFILDSADAGAEAIAAMQSGHTHLRSSAPAPVRAKLADMAKESRVTFVSGDYAALDLSRERDAKAACKAWLLAHNK